MKQCGNCKEIKELTEFTKCKRLKDGLNWECKICNNNRHKKYREINAEKEKLRRQKKYSENKEHELRKVLEYQKNRMLNDPSYKMLRRIRDRHSKAVKSSGKLKNFRNTELLGCESSFLKEYFEQLFSDGMNWDNYGKLWQIDHIHPLSRVDWDDVEQVKKVCHYTNLRPLLTELNLSKGNKLII
jgi:hypothetical protein